MIKRFLFLIWLFGLSACSGDFAYGPSAPKDEQVKHWGAVGNNQPIRVGPSRKFLLKSDVNKFFIQPGRDKYQTVDDYIDCDLKANNPALSIPYQRHICMLNKGYDFAESMTELSGRHEGYCGFENFRSKNLAFCRSTSHYQARLKANLEAKDNPLPDIQIWSSRHHSYQKKVIENIECSEIAGMKASHWSYYPYHSTWAECMTEHGYEFVDDVEDYKKYVGFCGWKPYFLKHTEFCLASQDSIYYERNMSLFKDYYELHGLPNPNDTTRPGDKDKQ
ncbi:hypothetical protein [Thiomicrospira pelophila]|uniref:hypothetical protein n=1 Tax=Thiomicrospira pelophila TaxID=934 RepID=UPI0004A6A95E|nr:hypothetical protein [Thiomicrospira pelophila]